MIATVPQTIDFSQQRVVPAKNVMIRNVADESILLNLSSTQYYRLDDVGTDMWTILTTSETIQIAFETLLAEYDVEPDRLAEDLRELISKLMEQSLIELQTN